MKDSTTGYGNVDVGLNAGHNITTGHLNTLVGGSFSGYVGGNITTGIGNCFVGNDCGKALTTGAGNTFYGNSSGVNLTTGSYDLMLGNNLSNSSVSVSHEMVISTYNSTGKGGSTGFINPNSGGVYQGNNSSSWSTTSDRRIKKNIVDNNTGLDAINQVQVRNFEYRTADEIDELPAHSAIDKQGTQIGVVAQEIQAVFPEMVKTEETGCMSVNPDNMTWYLVNAIKELKTELDAAKIRIATLEAG